MKQEWGSHSSHSLPPSLAGPPGSTGQQAGVPSQAADHAVWLQMNHPYANAYSAMANPFQPSPLSASTTAYDYSQPTSSGAHGIHAHHGHGTSTPASSDRKRPRFADSRDTGSDGRDESDEDDEDDDEDVDDDDKGNGKSRKVAKGPDGKPKVKLTRGSRACQACRKIKMRCIPDETSGPDGPCKRCKSGGHECKFEESNRGKRSSRKNEALTAKVSKMEAALRGIGNALGALDQPALTALYNALSAQLPDPEVLALVNVTSPSAGPAGRPSYSSYGSYGADSSLRGDADPSHVVQPPLSPRLHSLPDNVLSPLGLLAEASLQNTDKKYRNGGVRPSALAMGDRAGRNGGLRVATSDVRGGDGDEDESRGVASLNYFKPGHLAVATPGPDDRSPELLSLVTREEIGELFDLYFDKMSPHVPLIYRDFHTPDVVLQRSQFLCTVVCALAARYYTKRPELHTALSAYAKRLAYEVPSRGYKSVEVVQAYLLLAVWTLGPEKNFEQDRTWMMLGMAIRMATDLNLHRKSVVSGTDTEEGRQRDLEILNRERCWLHCFVLDRSLSAQMGKPYTLREDYIIRNACEASWHQQRFSLPSDRALSAYVMLQQIMSRAIDSIYSSTTTISGLRQDCDYMLIVRSAHEELRRWLTEWNKPDEFVNLPGEMQTDYDSRAQFYFAYSSLCLYSFGLENALERQKMDISFFLTNVYEAATRVCTVVKEQFVPKGYLPYLPDTNFVMCSYALLSLLKLLKPELRSYHDCEDAIFKLVGEVADLLEECAVDASHQPAIYAAFIREIIRKTRGRDGRSAFTSRVQSRVASRAGSPHLGGHGVNGDQLVNAVQQELAPENMFDPALIGEQGWPTGDVLAQEPSFMLVPAAGDMIKFSQDQVANPLSPTGAALDQAFPPSSSGNHAHWASYLPTYHGMDAFDGWDGSMLLPGYGRGQMTLAGGLLHSQFGSGVMTPFLRSPAGSRAASRAVSRAQSPR